MDIYLYMYIYNICVYIYIYRHLCADWHTSSRKELIYLCAIMYTSFRKHTHTHIYIYSFFVYIYIYVYFKMMLASGPKQSWWMTRTEGPEETNTANKKIPRSRNDLDSQSMHDKAVRGGARGTQGVPRGPRGFPGGPRGVPTGSRRIGRRSQAVLGVPGGPQGVPGGSLGGPRDLGGPKILSNHGAPFRG